MEEPARPTSEAEPQTLEGTPPAFDLEVDRVARASYAMAHNRIPVISRLAVSGVERDVQGARLLLDVSDATGSVIPTLAIAPGETFAFRLGPFGHVEMRTDD